MRKALLSALVLALGIGALAQTSDDMAITITITAAFSDVIDVPTSVSIQVARTGSVATAEQLITYSTDYLDRDITAVVQSVAGSIPTGFKLFISLVDPQQAQETDWKEIDILPPYEALTLIEDIPPGQNKTISFWLKADATNVDIGGAGQFTLTLRFTLVALG